MKIQLKHSGTLQSGSALPPLAEQMEYGELAINYNTSDPAIFIKDSTNNIIRIGGKDNISFTNYHAIIPIQATGPTSPVVGNLYFDTDDNRLYIYNGSAWVDASQEPFNTAVIPDTTNPAAQSGTLDDRYALTVGDTFTGNLVLNAGLNINASDIYLNNGKIIFEGTSADSFVTDLVVTNPTQNNTITLPDRTGTVITSGDSGTVTSTMIANGTIVDADINASAAIALTKLGNGALPSGITLQSSQISGGVSPGDVAAGALPSNVTVASANIVDGSIVDADINSSAAIGLSKLGTGALPSGITVSNAATTATHLNTANAIVARDASGDFTANNVTADLTGNATSSDKWSTPRTLTLNGDITGNASIDGSGSVTLTTAYASNPGTINTTGIDDTVQTSSTVGGVRVITGSNSPIWDINIDKVTINSVDYNTSDWTVSGNTATHNSLNPSISVGNPLKQTIKTFTVGGTADAKAVIRSAATGNESYVEAYYLDGTVLKGATSQADIDTLITNASTPSTVIVDGGNFANGSSIVSSSSTIDGGSF